METLAELPFVGDQVVCLSHDQAARSGPAIGRGAEVDEAVMQLVCSQCRAAPASCLAYNLGNFMRTLALPEKGQALVADEPQGKTRQDRREDRDPCLLRHIPDGRSRGAKTAVR